MIRIALLVAAVGCNSSGTGTGTGTRTGTGTGTGSGSGPGRGCEALPFAETIDVAEASGAVVLDDALLVVGDSGTGGAYVLVDRETGAEISTGRLPLGDGAGDDLEGLALDGDRIVGVTSAGWLRAWRRDGDGFALVDGPYSVGGDMACGATGVNCGKNYEGICVAGGDGPCAGWLASKADGRLWCLTRHGTRLRADRARSIAISDPDTLTGCDVDPATDTLWAVTNAFDGALYRVRGWRTPAETSVERVDGGVGLFPEAIAVAPGGVVYRLTDHTRAPSPAEKLRCR